MRECECERAPSLQMHSFPPQERVCLLILLSQSHTSPFPSELLIQFPCSSLLSWVARQQVMLYHQTPNAGEDRRAAPGQGEATAAIWTAVQLRTQQHVLELW